MRSISLWFCTSICLLFLTACESSEERAEAHYQKGVELLEAGDVDRGLVELRNVFELDGDHREARTLYARTVRNQGEIRQAYGQYLRLIEQYPDDVDGRIALAELSFQTANWQEFQRHGAAAVDLDPDRPEIRAIELALDFLEQVNEDPRATGAELTEPVQAALRDRPDSIILRRLIIDLLIRQERYSAALGAVDAMLEKEPDNRETHNLRLGLLARLGDQDGMETQLTDMVSRYPEDDALKGDLVRFLLSRQKNDEAEAFLRLISDPTAEDPSYYLTLVEFLSQTKGLEAAIAELDTTIAQDPENALLRALRAGLRFERGETDTGIAEMQVIVDEGEPSDELRRIKAHLARMLQQTGNEIGARKLVEEVLAEDPNQGDALRMQAIWHIEADNTDAAISALRTVLDEDPQNTNALGLMAEAHTRAGNHELAQDFLGLAMEASGQRPAESIRYAQVLMQRESYLAAEDTLLNALRRAPGNLQVMGALGQLYLRMDDDARLNQMIETLAQQGAPAAIGLGNRLRAAQIERNEGQIASARFMESLAAGKDEISIVAAQVRLLLLEEKPEEAIKLALEAREKSPENISLNFLVGMTRLAEGNMEEAEAELRQLTELAPGEVRIWLELARVLNGTGRFDEADTVVDAALEAIPDHPDLLWAKASYLERDGQTDDAIAIYEELYEQNSSSILVANNLASLLADNSTDEAVLERAWTIARRLRGAEVPALQDTYGWIAFRRGELDEALASLEPAAEGLPQDALVQYHLAQAYIEAGRDPEALEQLRRVLALVQVAPRAELDPDLIAEQIALAETRIASDQEGSRDRN